jgi:Lrp/AsnC family leucine-responsive transcriptional regulator
MSQRAEVDELDREILGQLDRNCRISSVELSDRVKRSRQTIEYRIARLEDRQIITGYTSSFNPTRVGYRLYKVYLRVRNVPGERERLHQLLYNLGTVYWVGESSGTWDLVFGIFYRSEAEILDITNRLTSEFHHIIVAHSGHTIVQILQYPKMYLTGELQPYRELAGEVRNLRLDALDVQIVALLIQNARLSLNQIGEELATSGMQIQRRLRKLEQLGILFQHRVSLNLGDLGLELYKAIITTGFYGGDDHRRFLDFISQRKEIQFFVRNIWSIELELVVPNYSVYESILDEIRRLFPKLISSLDTMLLESDEWTPAFANLLKQVEGPSADIQ